MGVNTAHTLTLSNSLVLVNAQHPLSQALSPDLTPVDEGYPEVLLERQAAALLNACLRAVGGLGKIVPVSGWRSREEQQAIWDSTLRTEGEAFTRQYVARPGCSEHETGLAIDLGLAAPHIDYIRPHFPDSGVCAAFRRRAAEYGFVLRYPAGKEAVTGIAHEPWHFRYVGVPHARIMARLELTLEEYVALARRHSPRDPLWERQGVFSCRVYGQVGAHPQVQQVSGGWQTVSRDNCGGWIVTQWQREAE